MQNHFWIHNTEIGRVYLCRAYEGTQIMAKIEIAGGGYKMTAVTLKVLYLVHDVSDPAVEKRVCMLRDGGANVRVAGFRRCEEGDSDALGAGVVDLGRTYNGGFVRRTLSVLLLVIFARQYRALFAEADVIIARNLEMLAFGEYEKFTG